jgi:hypothetical protein
MGVSGRIILKWILKEQLVKLWIRVYLPHYVVLNVTGRTVWLALDLPWFLMDRTVTHSASRYLLTEAAQVRGKVRSYGICGRQSGTGAGFLWVLRFPLPLIPPTAPYPSSSIIRCLYNRPNSGRRPSGLSLTPTPRNWKKLPWYARKHVVGYQRPDSSWWRIGGFLIMVAFNGVG